jgi:Tol biopolymer transport system component
LESGVEKPLSSHIWDRVQDLVWLKDNSGLALIASSPEEAFSQVWFLSFSGDRRRDLMDGPYLYDSLGVTAAGELTATQRNMKSSLWVMPSGDFKRVKQIGATEGRYGLAWTSDGKILYPGGQGISQHVRIVDPDGSNDRRLTFGAHDDDAPSSSPDGRYLFYCSMREPNGRNNIWRMDLQTGQLKRLTSGERDVEPVCSPDGKWIVYVSWEAGYKASIWKMPVDGGAATLLAGEITTNPCAAISPDGKWLAFYREITKWQRKRIEIISMQGGPPVKAFDMPDEANLLEWSLDSRALIHAEKSDESTNIWLMPLDGGTKKRLTDFKSGGIAYFAQSRDGAQIAFLRRIAPKQPILIRDFK